MDNWVRDIEKEFPVTAQRVGNGAWIAVWKCPPGSGADGYELTHPDAWFSCQDMEAAPDWRSLVAQRLGL